MPPEPAQRTASAGRPTRILLIDDHEVSRVALRALLQTEGFEVTDVATTGDPVSAAVTVRPAVAVVDVGPGQPAGFAIASQLASLPDPPPVVFTSSARRHLFGSQLDGRTFIAKADLCGGAVLKLAATSAPIGLATLTQPCVREP